MRVPYLYLTLFIGIAFAAHASAADFNNCQIVEVVVAGTSNAHVQLDCTIEPRPACAEAATYFGFDKSTEEGKQYLSVVLTAYASNARVTGYVDDTQCSPHQGNVGWLEHLRMAR